MRLKLTALLLVVMTAAAFSVGCGDDDSSDADNGSGTASEPITTSSLTKAQYVKQANTLCTRNRDATFDEVNEYIAENRGKSQEELIPGIVKGIYVPALEDQVEELRDLGAPAGDEKQIEAIMVAFEKSIDSASKLEGSSSNATINQNFDHSGRLARKYKLVECTYG